MFPSISRSVNSAVMFQHCWETSPPPSQSSPAGWHTAHLCGQGSQGNSNQALPHKSDTREQSSRDWWISAQRGRLWAATCNKSFQGFWKPMTVTASFGQFHPFPHEIFPRRTQPLSSMVSSSFREGSQASRICQHFPHTQQQSPPSSHLQPFSKANLTQWTPKALPEGMGQGVNAVRTLGQGSGAAEDTTPYSCPQGQSCVDPLWMFHHVATKPGGSGPPPEPSLSPHTRALHKPSTRLPRACWGIQYLQLLCGFLW